MNKPSGGDVIPAELFQILKDDAVKVLHSICHQIWKTPQWPRDWKRSVFIPIPKKGNAKECSNYHTTALISHISKVMLKVRGAGKDRGWDGWMTSLTQWTTVWSNSGRQWRTEKPGELQSMGSQRVEHNWATEQLPQKMMSLLLNTHSYFCNNSLQNSNEI